MLANQPNLVAWKTLPAEIADALRRLVSYPHVHGNKARRELARCPTAPAPGLPLCAFEHFLGGTRRDVGHVALAWSSAASNRGDHGCIGRIDLLLRGDADLPGQSAFGECLPERRSPGIGLYPPNRMPASRMWSISVKAISGLVPEAYASSGTLARSIRAASLIQLSGKTGEGRP